ncbi:hypothetical protein [Desulfovibrio sp. Fe33]|uniref:hypothetical protein n=1 Tax=Desulfovibrio sp. Fe33 TaxID=3020842 RepID=UPI00234D4D83|nr:hypothetical protein [Desulfovibrio sp. Fe33]
MDKSLLTQSERMAEAQRELSKLHSFLSFIEGSLEIRGDCEMDREKGEEVFGMAHAMELATRQVREISDILEPVQKI